jgi:23S rRNA pseudouridine1911/1915/1917 synthase
MMQIKETLTYTMDSEEQRLDRFLTGVQSEYSRSGIARLIREDRVRVNGTTATKTGMLISSGDQVELDIPLPQSTGLVAEDEPLEILFQDDCLVVVNKPSGIPVHPAGPRRQGTLVNRLLFHLQDLADTGDSERPGLVHRLDQETSGALLVARNDVTHRALSAQFAERTVDKHYLAVVKGEFKKEDVIEIDAPIGRSHHNRKKMAIIEGGRAARSTVQVVIPLGHHTIVLVQLHTGRTHQIRVHLAHKGHPVLGDKVYGYKPDSHYHRVVEEAMKRRAGAYLHAYRLAFTHPHSGQRIAFTAPVPEDMRILLEAMGVSEVETELEKHLR